jgi:HTH-type transcriptional regulator, competence development regulator
MNVEAGMETNGETFGATVRMLREKQKIGLRELARTLGVSPTYLSKVERDQFDPPTEQRVRAIAAALNRDPDELLALAGRLSADLADIIQREPKGMATFLRAANGMTSAELVKLAEEIGNRRKGE